MTRWIAFVLTLLLSSSALAEGNFLTVATQLRLEIDKNLNMSEKRYEIETGKFYIWTIRATDTADELFLMAPQLWRNSFIDQVKIGKADVHAQAIYDIDLDDEAEVKIYFVPMRPGRYRFWFDLHEERGMVGEFIVR